MKYSELNDFYNEYDGEETVAHYMFETILPRVMWHLFENQEEWVYMSGEDGRKYPEMKDNAWQYIYDQVVYDLGFDICELTRIAMDMTYRGIVNAGDNAWEMKEHFGHDFPDWETVYPDGVPWPEYKGEGMLSARPAYNFHKED